MSYVVELFDMKEAAKRLGTSVDHVKGLVEDGRLRFVNIGRGTKRPRYRFTESDIADFIEASRKRGETPQCRSLRSSGRPITTSSLNSKVSVSRNYGDDE